MLTTTQTHGTADQTLLRAARRAQNLRQEDVATAAKIDRGYLSALERGLRKPGPRTRVKLAAVLGLEPDEITEAP